jgi:hypothetical protein
MSRKTVLLFPGQRAYRARYATALDYPVEVYTEDMEPDADLGVDSVKQTALLSHAADRYQLRCGQRIFDEATTQRWAGLQASSSAPSQPSHVVRRQSISAFGLTRAQLHRRHQK